jgi:hypothetical protein
MAQAFITQVKDQKYWAGLTKPNHMMWAGYDKGPSSIDDRLNNIYDLVNGDDNLVSMTDKFATKYVDSEVYKWYLKGPNERNIPLLFASTDAAGSTVVSSTSTNVGLGFSTIYLWFPEKYFFKGSVVAGNRPEDYKLRIDPNEEPVAVGNKVRYKATIYGGDSTSFFPNDELAAGTRWSEFFHPVERDLSRDGSESHYGSFYELQNRISTIRKKLVVTGSMIARGSAIPLLVKFQGDKGETFEKWIDYATWQFKRELRQEKAKLLLYGTSTITNNGESTQFGPSGNPILAGYGLYDQLKGGNISYYNNFSIDGLLDFLTGLSFNKIAEDKRNFLITTGSYGKVQFHRAAERYLSQKSWYRSDRNISTSGDTATFNEGQIDSLVLPGGIKVDIMIDPMLDSPTTVAKIPHPMGGSVSSYIYNIWDIGTANGEQNIQKVAIKGDEEYMRYLPGMRDPFSPNGGGMQIAVSPVDGYEVHAMANCSLRVTNPLRCGRYLPTIYKGVY